MKLVLTGNEAAAFGAKLARAQVISAYPITPQTVSVEKLAEFVANGELDAEFVEVESEHSALSVCVGAAAAGARAFTATSSQGLALMSEILYIAAGLRLPIVMANVNRSLSAPISIWCDQQDSISVRDCGWIQLYCENNQEILDSIIQAYKIGESVHLPVMVCYDGYILSHTAEVVDVPDQSSVDEFLPPYQPPYKLDPENPVTMGPVGVPEYYQEFRYALHEAVREAKEKVIEVDRDFERRFGRGYGLIENYRCDDAEVVVITMGSLSGTVKEVIDKRRERGDKVGMIKVRCYRPFPHREILGSLESAEGIAVMEKDISLGATGALYADVTTAIQNSDRRPLVMDFICGLGGRDVKLDHVEETIETIKKCVARRKIETPVKWLGLRKEVL